MALTPTQKEEIMNMCKDMRTTDVRDGMDWMGYHYYGTMSTNMRPLFRTRAMGFAKTSRYIPYDKPVPQGKIGEAYTEWSNWFYQNICIYPWIQEVEKYDMCVIDQSNIDTGIMGSMNALIPLMRGGTGFVIYGGIRDTDEVILEKVPVWSTKVTQPMDQARIQYESHNTKINCDGVCVNPGDFVVADGDGVIVVPQDIVYDVAKYATQEMSNDKVARRIVYEKLDIPFDETVDVTISDEEREKFEKLLKEH